DSPDLAANYENEFKLMFEQHKFGPSKNQGALKPELTIDGVHVRNYFSPEDGVESKLVALVNGAQKSIYFMAFSFTEDHLGAAIKKREKQGRTVRKLQEKERTETESSKSDKKKNQGTKVYQDSNPYIMHHKVIIVDQKTVAFGSYNFSDSAEESNDENSLIID